MKISAERLDLPWAPYQIRKIVGCACAGNAGNVFPATAGWRTRHASRHVRDARALMHAGIANKWLPWKSVAGKMFPAFPAHALPAIVRTWKEDDWVAQASRSRDRRSHGIRCYNNDLAESYNRAWQGGIHLSGDDSMTWGRFLHYWPSLLLTHWSLGDVVVIDTSNLSMQ